MNAVEIQRLAYRYPNGTEALRDINCAVAEGECIGLIGPNGAGKSTLLLHLNGILPETIADNTGVTIFGQLVCRQHLDAVRRTVGLLFQNPDDQLFCPTVFEDVAFGPRQYRWSEQEVATRVREVLRRVGLQGFNAKSPHHLSQGEKRRVCLAGVMACEARLLVLDEPTSDLDPRGRREFQALLRTIPSTKIIASHDLEMIADLCNRVLVLDGGRKVAEGPTMELLNDEALMLAHGLERPHSLRHRHPH